MSSLCEVSDCVACLHQALCRARAEPRKSGDSSAGDEGVSEALASEGSRCQAMSADDFLPLFTWVMMNAAPPDLITCAELCSQLLDPDEAINERGYYVASFQAAISIALNLDVKGTPEL